LLLHALFVCGQALLLSFVVGFVFPKLTYWEGAHQDQVFLLLGEGGRGGGGWREARKKRENLVSSSCEKEKERKRDSRLRSTHQSILEETKLDLLYLCTKERKALTFAFLCFSLLVKSQFEISGFLVSSSIIIIIVYAQRFFLFAAGMLFFSFLD
jgi:hypothetical protein